MGVPAAYQVTLQAATQGATVRSWSLPAFVVAVKSPSVWMATGDDLVIIRQRIAEALGIQNGDTVNFLVNEIGETWRLQVKIRDDISSDILIHDLFGLGIAETFTSSGGRSSLTLKSGTVLHQPHQEMWAGMSVIEYKGSAKLFFDGASRNNPHGPCGYGFHIERLDNASKDTLVQGSGYSGMEKSSNQMEYEGLIEGLVWATRLRLTHLTVVGDSELIIKQLTGEYSIKNHRLRALNEKVKELLDRREDLNVSYVHVPREENQIADSLANQAIATRMRMLRHATGPMSIG